jgi:MoaA/NifB/PqqE/SkfB family radical SAM enzyme
MANNSSFDITLTLLCNNDCFFCPRKDFLKFIVCRSKKEIYQEMEKISRKSPKIVLSGGEITVFPEIFEILNFCRTKFKDIEIITNGRKLKDKKFLEKLISFGVNNFGVSIYTLSDDIHDKITGKKRSCRETKKGLLNLLNVPGQKIKIRVNITLNYWNAPTIIKTIKKLYLWGIKDFAVAEEIILSKKNKVLTLEQVGKILKEIANLKLGGIRISLKGFPPCFTKKYLGSFIKFEPYRLESCPKKGMQVKKYFQRFQNNFINPKQCSNCLINDQCLGVQKCYPDINQFIQPIK